MTSNETPQAILALLRVLQISPKYHGHHYIAKSVQLVMENNELLLDVTKKLYPMVAEIYGTRWTNVEHDMRTVINKCWKEGDHSLLEDIAGRELTKKPRTVDFIDILANFLLHHGGVQSP